MSIPFMIMYDVSSDTKRDALLNELEKLHNPNTVCPHDANIKFPNAVRLNKSVYGVNLISEISPTKLKEYLVNELSLSNNDAKNLHIIGNTSEANSSRSMDGDSDLDAQEWFDCFI